MGFFTRIREFFSGNPTPKRELVPVPAGVVISGQLESSQSKSQTPAPRLATQPDLWVEKALEITGGYEGKTWGTVSGDHDRQGLSVGMLHWNYGHGSLQTQILKPYIEAYGSIDALKIFPGVVDLTADMDPETACDYVRKTWLTGPGGTPRKEWALAWYAFMASPKMIEIQKKAAQQKADAAMNLCNEWGFVSPRAFCFFFDMIVQDGGLKGVQKAKPDLNVCKKLMTMGEAHNQKLWDTVAIDKEMNVLFQAAYARAQSTNYVVDAFARRGSIALGLGYVRGTVYSFDFTKL